MTTNIYVYGHSVAVVDAVCALQPPVICMQYVLCSYNAVIPTSTTAATAMLALLLYVKLFRLATAPF
jgi:hypothetical protein